MPRSTPRPTALIRTAAIFGAGLAIGLGCGGGGGAPASDHDRFLDETVIAEVGSYVLTARDLTMRLQNQFPDLVGDGSASAEQSIREILSIDLEHLCLISEAERVGFDDTSQVFQQRLEMARRQTLQKEFTFQVIHKRAEPTEEEVFAHYEANQARYSIEPRVAARHLLVATEAEAKAARARVEAGESFADVATELTQDETSRRSGGATGWLHAGRAVRGLGDVPGLVEAALGLEENELGIVETDLGWHVVTVIRKEEGGVQPFGDVRQAIFDNLHNTRAQTELGDALTEYRQRYGARINDEGLTAFLAHRRRDDEAELFSRAQELDDPRAKVETYQEYLEKFPHSEHACEAQFMIAFTTAEELKETQEARRLLNEFIKTCPESELIDSARFLLDELSARKK
jgi:peptidyl-prolyl cis-trans isomerase C